MTRPKPVRLDQIRVQEALRTAARRCALWARDHVRGTARRGDERFVQEFVQLVRRYEKESPTRERSLVGSDKTFDRRIRDAGDDFSTIIRNRKRTSGRVPPNAALFSDLSACLDRHGFEVTPEEARRAFQRWVAENRSEEVITDVSKDIGDTRLAARTLIGALALAPGSGPRTVHKRAKEAAAEPPDLRVVTIKELVRYLAACLAIGPYTAEAIAGVVEAAYRRDRLPLSSSSVLRDVVRGRFFAEPVRPRPAYRRMRSSDEGT